MIRSAPLPSLVWVAIGGIATALAFPLQPIPYAPPTCLWPLIFVSLSPFLARLMSCEGIWGTVQTALVFAVPWFVIAGVWVFRVFDALGWVLIWLPIGWVVVFAISANLVRWHGFNINWSWPALWLAMEFIRAEWSPFRLNWLSAELDPLNFTWFGLGHPRLAWPPAAQSADLIGGYGLALAPFLTNLLIAQCWTNRTCSNRYLVFGVIGFCAADASYSTWRWHQSQSGETVAVGIVQSERFELPVLTDLTDSLMAAAPYTKLVVWPELSFSAKPGDQEQLHEFAKERGINLVAGVEIPTENGYRNRAWWLPHDGPLGEYAKRTRVPFVERHPSSQACSTFPFQVGDATIHVGVLVCYDIDFSWPARELVNGCGAQLIALPTLDDVSWGGTQHAQHALLPRLRAIENRRPIVQAATSGVSQILDDRGHTLAGLPFRINTRPGRPTVYREGFAYADLTIGNRPSIFSKIGHLIPPVVAGFAILLVAWAMGWQGLASLRRADG